MADPAQPTPPPGDESQNPVVAKVTKDMSQYIRTYAKDVARLTNQPPPPSPVAAQAAEDTGVTLPEVDASPVNRPDGIVKEFPQEVLDVTKEDSAGIFANQPPAPPPPPVPTDDERREEVLARLRAKLEDAPPPPPPQPAPPPPPPQPYIPPAPPPGVVPVQKPETEPTPLHTYTSDFADRIDQQQASTFSVLAAQEDARQGEPILPARKKKGGGILAGAFAVLLILVGVGGVIAAYKYVGPRDVTKETLGVPSLILADEKMELPGPDYRQDLADAAGEPLVEGNILITYLTSASSTALGTRNAPQPGGALIRELDLGAPDILLRNVDLSSTVGIVSAGGETRPFFILRVNSYERTFAGMLGWESRMLTDLEPFYPEYINAIQPAATTTATTSIPLPPPLLPSTAPREFVDAVVANHDVRLVKDRMGRTLLIYGYHDKETLIIARDEAAFTALSARLAATKGQ